MISIKITIIIEKMKLCNGKRLFKKLDRWII